MFSKYTFLVLDYLRRIGPPVVPATPFFTESKSLPAGPCPASPRKGVIGAIFFLLTFSTSKTERNIFSVELVLFSKCL